MESITCPCYKYFAADIQFDEIIYIYHLHDGVQLRGLNDIW